MTTAMNRRPVILSEWPDLGKVGICRRGPSTGQHVLLIGEGPPIAWLLYLEPPWENFRYGESVFSFDNSISWEEDAERITNEWGVEWLPEGDVEAQLEADVFGMRAEIVKHTRRVAHLARFSSWLTSHRITRPD